ncbi:DUF5722 domain-containing protein [Actinopolymorpha singaporensis]|uniref:DUF5722 domain-containing protein n=1 Tax=Actinopolymorpha singaporensis TaxID=117157 RepID=UPI0012FE07DB|nr:DUF5722 domain-containing protein [Actinopolymorpha singaporensis]
MRHRSLLTLASVLAGLLAVTTGMSTAAVASPAVTVPGNASASADANADGIAAVSAQETTVEVSGRATEAGDQVSIYALGAEADAADYTGGELVARTSAGAGGAFDASFPRTDQAGHDRLYDQYVAVVGSGAEAKVVGGPRYVDRLDFAPARDFDYPKAASKKGLQVEMTDDAEELGVQHAGINVAFNELMRNGPGDDPSKVVSFESGGRTFYFDADAVARLDGQIKPLSDNGILVNLILILYRSGDPNSAWPVLHDPDATVGSGTVYAFNTRTAEGVAYFTAAMEFLADRYTRADQAHGRAVGYIVGNEVDAQWVWANSGDKPLGEFLTTYARAVRIAWQATQKFWAGARTYISLTHCWTTVCGDNPDPANPTRFYAGKDVIDQLNALTKRTGDVGWNVAYHPYPQDLFDPAFWNDQAATPGFDTQQITFKNIEVLPDYLAQDDLTYAGSKRRIILSEQGCNTPGDTADAERLQAACYAYAYYKIRFLDGIDAFILHRHVDHQQEGGLRLGLWTWDDQRSEAAMPGRHKLSYDVFTGIDTARSLEVTDFAKAVIGIRDWADVIPGFDPGKLAERTPPTQVGTRNGARPVRPDVLADFETGLDGWRVSDNAATVQTVAGGYHGRRALRVRFDAAALPAWSRDAKTWKGADVVLPKPVNADATPRLSLAVRVPKPAAGEFKPGNAFYAKVRAYAGDGQVAYGLARLDPDRGWNVLSLDLSGWQPRSQLARVKVWVRGSTDDDWRGSFDLDYVALSGEVAPAGAVPNIDVSATLAEHHPVGSKLSVTVTNNDVRPLAGKLALQPCGGVSVTPETLDVGGIGTGAGETFDTTVTAFDPADPDHPVICAAYEGLVLPVEFTVPPATPTSLFTFDDGVQGWVAGENVTSVARVGSFANGPGSPHGGSGALEATGAAAPASARRTVAVDLTSPLDLSGAKSVVAWVDSYGGAPGATGYEATLTVVSGSERRSTTVSTFTPDRWNELRVDVGDWAQRNKVTRLEVGFRAIGSDTPWSARFQVDDVAYLD